MFTNRSKKSGQYRNILPDVIAASLPRFKRVMMTKKKPQKKAPYKKPSYKKKTYVKRASNVVSRIRTLEKRTADTMSKLIYKFDTKDTLRASASTAVYGYRDAVATATIELALAQARYFDPSTPGTLITGSLASPTFQQNIMVSAFSNCIIKNNYQVPCYVTYGVAFPKDDTNIDPSTARTNGLTDVGNPDQGSTLLSFRDSPQFVDLWSYKSRSKVLKPGDQLTISHGQKQFTYDPSFQDSHSLTYQRKTKSALFVYRCQGILGHDSAVSTEQGMLPAGFDVYVTTTYYITYNSGGASVRTIVLNETASQSFTNGGVVSQIMVDNQAYSVA